MDARFHFVSTYRVAGDPDRVWQVLSDVGGWTRWWRGLERVDLVAGPVGPAGAGAIYRQTVHAPLGYRLTYDLAITRIDPMRSVDAAVTGDLAGRGRAAVSAEGEESTIWFAWLVETTKPWMRRLSPVARPAFSWAHRRLMAGFGAGFAEASGARLLSVGHREIRPGEPGFWMLPEEPGGTASR